MGYNTLINYYNTIFNMQKHHKYSVSEIESMYPWERDLYAEKIKQILQDQTLG